jgi:hypothetical protein
MGVDFAPVGRALRSGAWKKLGKYPLRDELGSVRPVVQWPVGTLDVTVWIGRVQSRLTRVEDPSIQDLEIVASWDAVHHVPARLAVVWRMSLSANRIPLRRDMRSPVVPRFSIRSCYHFGGMEATLLGLRMSVTCGPLRFRITVRFRDRGVLRKCSAQDAQHALEAGRLAD